MKGTAKEITICGKSVGLGDTVKVKYASGGSICGKIVELWGPEQCGHHQGRVESGWCFHNNDQIVEHQLATD